MLIAGLTGGLASGKSFVAKALAAHGAHVIEADLLGHEVLARDGAAYEPVVAAFGPGILDAEGWIDRKALGDRVFANPDELGRLNRIVHPAVRTLAKQRMREIETRDPNAVVIYVAAILFESGAYRDVGKVIVTDCSREQQLARAVERGTNRESAGARISKQMSSEERKARADYVIDTSGTPEETLRQTSLVWENLVRQAAR